MDTPLLSLISDFVGANVWVLPAVSAIVVEPPVTIVVLPDASLNVADVKPLNTFARRIFNVPAPSDTTPMLPVVKSAGVVTPPLMDNTSPCLRTDVVPVSPSNLCSASANACAVFALDLVIASLIAVATFCVVATPFLPAVVPCVEPLAPILPVVSSRTSLPSSTFTVYVFTPPVVLSDTVARPVPVTLTASCADVTAKSLMTVLPADEILDKSLSADFSAAVTAAVNLAVGAIVTLSPVADVVINALAPVSPLMLNVIAFVLSFFAVVEPASLPRAMVLLPNAVVASVADFTASSICFLLTAASSVVALPTFLICVLPASIPEPFNLTVLVPSVAVTPAGATVVVFVPSVVDRPPLVIVVVLPAPSAIVEEAPVTVCVLPDPSVNVADVKPVKAFAILIFNVPDAVSPTTAILPDVRSVAVVDAPPLILSCSPCLRLITVASSPAKLCFASAKACAVLALDLVIASLIAVATFCVVATPFLPAVVPCVEPAAPTLPVVSSITSLPSSTLTVYVLTPAAVLSDTVARPVPVTVTASCAAALATFLTAFSDTATS